MNMKKQFKKVGTHNGKFHADEIMATAILKEIFNIELVRTRDKRILDELDIVYDVNGGELDHHDTNKKYRDNKIPYAACGLVWNKYGKDVLYFIDSNLKEEEIQVVFEYIDRSLLEGIDALDNGVKIDSSEIPLMNISGVLSGFNPPWNCENKEDEAFYSALEVASSILRNKIDYKLSVLKAKNKVVSAYKCRDVKEILVIDTYCPYSDTLKEIDKNHEIYFVVFKGKDNYILQTVRDEDGNDRKKLPEAWLGKRDKDLAEVTGVPDAVFCHTGRFIASALSFEGIMKLAKLAVNEPKKSKRCSILDSLKKLFSK